MDLGNIFAQQNELEMLATDFCSSVEFSQVKRSQACAYLPLKAIQTFNQNGASQNGVCLKGPSSTTDESPIHQQKNKQEIPKKVPLDLITLNASTHNCEIQQKRINNRKIFGVRDRLVNQQERSRLVNPFSQQFQGCNSVINFELNVSQDDKRQSSSKGRTKRDPFPIRNNNRTTFEPFQYDQCLEHQCPSYICNCQWTQSPQIFIKQSQKRITQQFSVDQQVQNNELQKDWGMNIDSINSSFLKIEKKAFKPSISIDSRDVIMSSHVLAQNLKNYCPNNIYTSQNVCSSTVENRITLNDLNTQNEQNDNEYSDSRSSASFENSSDQIEQSNQIGLNPQKFICVTCKRGPPQAKKYAKNQCQTCYKRNKLLDKGMDQKDYQMKQLAEKLLKEVERSPDRTFKAIVNDYFKRFPSETANLNKKEFRKYLKMLAPPSSRHQGREPRKWNGCPLCKKDKARHYAKGFCSLCYRKLKKANKLEQHAALVGDSFENTL